MSRRDQWKQVKDSMFMDTEKSKTMDEREKVPDIACGVCRNFSENAYASDGRGTCKILKIGSNITLNPPVLITSGDNGYITFFNTEASACTHFSKMVLIDKDGRECADPAFRRAQRQMEKAGK